MSKGIIVELQINQRSFSLIWNLFMVAFPVLLSATTSGCFRSSDTRTNGTETHFLKMCSDSCGDNLQCVSGLCTRECQPDDNSCSELSDDAICTSEGLSSGTELVCDVPCRVDTICSEMDEQLRCADGFCRDLRVETNDQQPLDSGNQTTGQSDAGEQPNQTTGQSDAGEQPHVDGGVATAITIIPCSEADATEIVIDDYSVRDDKTTQHKLILDIEFRGCEEDDIALCYISEFRDVFYPVIVGTRFIRFGPEKYCGENPINRTLEIDLSPIASSYKERYDVDGGLVALPFGPYVFGEQSCQDRQKAAEIRSSEALLRANKACSNVNDCMSKTVVTSCYFQCNAGVLSRKADQQLEDELATIDEEICGDLMTAGCDQVGIDPCPSPLEVACIDGTCVDVNSSFSELQRCTDALNLNHTLGVCSSDCFAYDGCCLSDVWCVDQYMYPEGEWSCTEAIATSCTAGEPTASISGTTPFGPVDFQYGLASFSHAFAVDLRLIFTRTDSAKTCGDVRLGVDLNPFFAVDSYENSESAYPGLYEVPVTLYKDNSRVVGDGRIEILEMGENDSSVKGTLEVIGKDWDFRGEFDLSECDDLDRSGP